LSNPEQWEGWHDARVPYEPLTDAERVATALRAELADVASGTRLPSVRELASRFGVSSTSVTRALATLKAEGLVVSRQGLGTYRA
jgi:DNA-binding GntR family transcriptional regulator